MDDRMQKIQFRRQKQLLKAEMKLHYSELITVSVHQSATPADPGPPDDLNSLKDFFEFVDFFFSFLVS